MSSWDKCAIDTCGHSKWKHSSTNLGTICTECKTICFGDSRVYAPWTEEQVSQLNKWQASRLVHPFTCCTQDGNDIRLVATAEGWECPVNCGYKQNWAYREMLQDPKV